MKLSKPIMAHGEMVTELTLREPNGGDLMRNGFPFEHRYEASGVVRITDAAVIGRMIRDLAAIPESSVAQLNWIDFARLQGEVLDFFLAEETQATS